MTRCPLSSDSVSPPETEVQSSPMHVAGSAAAPSTVPVAAISSASLELQELRGDVMALRSMAGQMTAALGRIVHLMHKRGEIACSINTSVHPCFIPPCLSLRRAAYW